MEVRHAPARSCFGVCQMHCCWGMRFAGLDPRVYVAPPTTPHTHAPLGHTHTHTHTRTRPPLIKLRPCLSLARHVQNKYLYAAGDIDTGSSDDDSDDELDMGIEDDGESYGNDRRRPRAAPSGTY